MAEPKTQPTSQDPKDFLNMIEPEERRVDGFALLEIFKKATGEEAVMWGSGIVGFGKYYFRSENSKQEVEWPLSAFSMRKQNITLYIMDGTGQSADLLGKLGKHKTSKACLYINKLSDVDQDVLFKLIEKSFQNMKKVKKG